jgi:hypothetical protein
MRNASIRVLLLLAVAGAIRAQSPCLFTFTAPSSTATAAGSSGAEVVQRLNNGEPTRSDCPPVPEPVAPWIRIVSHRAGPAASTDFAYRILENFETTGRTATLRVNGAAHQIQQGAGPANGRAPRMAVRGSDGLIRMYVFAGASALTAQSLTAASDPATFQGGSCLMEVLVRDTQDRLAAYTYNGCQDLWGAWRNLGGTVRGRPALVQQPGDSMLAVTRDQFGGYWMRRFPLGGSTGTWQAMGGIFASDPAMTVDSAGVAYILARDLWNTLWMGRVNSAGQFLGWTFAGGLVRGQPAITAGSDGLIYAAARDPWGGLNLLRWLSNAPLGWSRGGNGLAGDPVITAPGDGSVYLGALGENGGLRYRSFTEGSSEGWSPWVEAGGNARHLAVAGIGGEALFGVVDTSSQLLWYRPATAEWRNFGVQVAGAGLPGAAP